jgi:hypothetical protein
MARFPLLVLLVLVGTLVGCPVRSAVISSVSPERAAECKVNCEQLGMKLTAVVLMMNSAGCVCEPVQPAAPATAPQSVRTTLRSAVLAGAATIQAEEDAAEQNRQSHQQSK